ncbi:MAG: PD40 domain-containing protein [Acidobacteria bacterium]|nr:PD40 domain-containing protein [Acidobacteriota bacterium]
MKTCLAKDPEERWQSAHDLKRELQWIVEGGSAVSPSSRPAAPVSRLPWALFALTALAALALAVVHFRESPPEARPIRFSVSPPDKATLGESLAISPDGMRLALIVSTPGSGPSLWIRRLDSLTAQPLPGTEGADQPFWSPDSRFIAFFAQGKLKKIDASGGPAQTLCDAPGFASHGAWSREGVIVFSPTRPGPLYRVSAEGGPATPVTAIDQSRQEDFHAYPQFLPDGRRFLYLAFFVERLKNNGIYVGSLDSKDRKFLVASHWMAAYAPGLNGQKGYVLFVREGTLLAQWFDPDRLQLSGEPLPLAEKVTNPSPTSTAFFSVSANGVLAFRPSAALFNTQLVWFDRGGKPLGTVGPPSQNFALALSPDGKRVAVQRNDPQTGNGDIWLLELARGGVSRFTFDPANDGGPVWSPGGGRMIVFASNRDGNWNLYEKPSSGLGNEEPLWKSSDNKWPTDWSWDGRFIAYDSVGGSKTRGDVWILPGPGGAPGERKPFPFLQTEFDELGAHFSPDGRWIAYASNEIGRSEVYVQPFTGAPSGASRSGAKWQVSTNGGADPRWRGDGKELFYTENNKIMAVEVKAGSTFEAGFPKMLFELPNNSAWDITADGQRFLVIVPVEQASTPSPITVVVNWPARLKR